MRRPVAVAALSVAIAGLCAPAREQSVAGLAAAGRTTPAQEPGVATILAAAGPTGWAPLDGFEDPRWPDPGLWTVLSNEPPTWWPSSCAAHSGEKALWAFGGPTARGELPCAAPAPAGTTSSILMTLDFTDVTAASRLDLFFELWLGFPPNSASGVYVNLLVPEEDRYARVPVFGAVGLEGRWAEPIRRLDLLSLASIEDPDEVYDLRGGRWHLEWLAVAPNGANAGAGAYIDDVSLVWEPDPAVPTPTTRPTAQPTPTASATPTATPSPTLRPVLPAHLPVAWNGFAVRPSPTATWTDTPDPNATPSATDTPGAGVTPVGTATPTATVLPPETPSGSGR